MHNTCKGWGSNPDRKKKKKKDKCVNRYSYFINGMVEFTIYLKTFFFKDIFKSL